MSSSVAGGRRRRRRRERVLSLIGFHYELEHVLNDWIQIRMLTSSSDKAHFIREADDGGDDGIAKQ